MQVAARPELEAPAAVDHLLVPGTEGGRVELGVELLDDLAVGTVRGGQGGHHLCAQAVRAGGVGDPDAGQRPLMRAAQPGGRARRLGRRRGKVRGLRVTDPVLVVDGRRR